MNQALGSHTKDAAYFRRLKESSPGERNDALTDGKTEAGGRGAPCGAVVRWEAEKAPSPFLRGGACWASETSVHL